MGRALLIAAVLATGCGAELNQGGTDARPVLANDASVTDDAPGPDAAPDAPACANGRVVYLNFDGQALTRAAPSDATMNRASWMNQASGTAAPFRQASGNRTTDITTITDGIRAVLAGFPVTVVTTRPAAGPYVMVVFGGAMGAVGSNFSLAVNELDCDDSEKSDVLWISDATGVPLQRLINVTVGGIGFGLGLTATADPNDCMCGWANGCTPTAAQACTLSMSIARDPDAGQLCPAGGASQNELLAFDTAFCQ